ncbi:MAG: hypothetical protein WB661_08845 [Candidatus Bathyarchaeia archaeon]
MPASYPPSAYGYGSTDVVQQGLGLLSRLWFSLTQEERAMVISLLPYAFQGHPAAIQRLRQWVADRSRYDRPYT